METHELQQLVEEISLKDFKQPFRHKAAFNRRLRTTGGRYHLNSHDLDFNPKVLNRAGKETLVGVIKHELCHYHLHLNGKGYQHKDKDFKNLLKEVDGLRYTPSLKDSSQPIKVWKYRCRKCGSIAQRRRRFNTEKFVCAKCQGRFKLLGETENQTAVD